MATASNVQIPVTVTSPGIQLTLSMDEAQTILELTRCVGGCPERTRRKFSQLVALALVNAGVHSPEDANGTIYFDKII
jgi:hypothetical protein